MSSVLLTYNNNTVDLPFPVYGYITEIKMPFTFSHLDDGTITIRDEGIQYDRRNCKVSFLLDASKQEEYNTFFNTTARAKSVVMTMDADCGFYPFGVDKGDTGPFTISAQRLNTPPIQLQPFRYFKCDLLFTNVGAYTDFIWPVVQDEGNFNIGGISDLQMPQQLFEPQQEYTISVNHTENSTAQYFDRGSLGDSASVRFVQQVGTGKCGDLLYYLVVGQRTSTFPVYTDDYYYIFGADHGSDTTFTVKLNSDKITIRHIAYNSFEIDLAFKMIGTL